MDTSTHLERERGFKDRLQVAGVTPIITPSGYFDYEVRYRVAQGWFAQSLRPDAVFCINVMIGLAAIDAEKGGLMLF